MCSVQGENISMVFWVAAINICKLKFSRLVRVQEVSLCGLLVY